MVIQGFFKIQNSTIKDIKIFDLLLVCGKKILGFKISTQVNVDANVFILDLDFQTMLRCP